MPAYRADQILDWVYVRGVIDPAKMTNLSRADRETVARDMTFLSGLTLAEQRATDGVRKLLIEWDDGAPPRGTAFQGGDDRGTAFQGGTSPPRKSPCNTTDTAPPIISLDLLTATGDPPTAQPPGDPTRQTECVMIPALDTERRTACISSQVGCPVGCRFCASGLGGLDANLSAGRIVEQVWRLQYERGDLGPSPQSAQSPEPKAQSPSPRITNIVFMGMGEPLSNFAAVMHAIRTLAAPWAFGISARKITVSTVGLPKAIERLAQEMDLPVTLALSLHAPNDELRRKLIPWAEYTTIADLLAACRKWFDKTGREITLEYILLGGVNDQPEHADELARVARTLRANVNLIRYNEVGGLDFKRPDTDDVRAFQEILRARGVNTHIRASRGRDIAAACGQLRHEKAAV